MSTQSEFPESRRTVASAGVNPFGTRAQAQRRSVLVPLILVIAIDATGSMDNFFRAIVRAIHRMIDIFTSGNFEPHLGLVVFRDEKYGEMPEVYEIGTPPEKIKRVLSETEPSGGGDEPESSLPALMRAAELIDNANVQAASIILHISDSGCHDPEDGHTAESVLDALKDHGVIVFECTPAIEPYKNFADATGGTLFEIEPHMDEAAFENVLIRFAKASVNTVQAASAHLDDDVKAILREASDPR